jgi:hypothetical protein
VTVAPSVTKEQNISRNAHMCGPFSPDRAYILVLDIYNIMDTVKDYVFKFLQELFCFLKLPYLSG